MVDDWERRWYGEPRFNYELVRSYEEAVFALREHGEGAKALAGGQSLVPLMNLRLLRPSALIDLNGIVAVAPRVEAGRLVALGHDALLPGALLGTGPMPGSVAGFGDCPRRKRAGSQSGHARRCSRTRPSDVRARRRRVGARRRDSRLRPGRTPRRSTRRSSSSGT